jgi:hypothetical protein
MTHLFRILNNTIMTTLFQRVASCFKWPLFGLLYVLISTTLFAQSQVFVKGDSLSLDTVLNVVVNYSGNQSIVGLNVRSATTDSTGKGGVFYGGEHGVIGESKLNIGVLGKTENGVGIKGLARASGGTGIYGIANSISGNGIGVSALARSGSGTGIYVENSSMSGSAYGLNALSKSDAGIAIRGEADALSGLTTGIFALVRSDFGRAIYGNATSTTGPTMGVYGRSVSSSGYGIFGQNNSASGLTYGVYGQVSSNSGIGVHGSATSTSGPTIGLKGAVASPSGSGVLGINSSTSGVSRGVYGSTASSSGQGVYGIATYGGAQGSAAGVYGIALCASCNGVEGYSTSIGGVGGYFEAQSVGSYALWAKNTQANGRAGLFDGSVVLVNGSDADNSSSSGFLTIGNVNSTNIVFDNNEIIARNNGTAATLHMQATGGNVQIGSSSSRNLFFDDNEIKARNNGEAGTMWVQFDGGDLMLCAQEQGAVAIGVQNVNNIPSGYLLAVDGKGVFEEVRVELSGNWPDYVFKSNYSKPTLPELKDYIDKTGHLPNIPSAKDVEEDGLHLGEMQRLMMEKIEELTLYIIDLNNQITQVEQKLNER